MNKIILEVKECDIGKRLDVFIAQELQISRSAAAVLIEDGGVSVSKKNHKLEPGEVITVIMPEPRTIDVVAQDIPLDIVFEDEDMLVINKARGMVVHPACGNPDGTLVNALLAHCGDGLSGINGVLRPGIVHRLDKDTSGLMLVAKTDFAHKSLAMQIKEHSVKREYYTVVIGNIKDDCGKIEAPIGRHHTDRKRMSVTERNSKSAVTNYRVLSRYRGFCLLACLLETGRTHQIRVHMSHIGHPVVGDTVYGARDKLGLSGQCLHSKSVSFTHPRTGERMEFESELPQYFADILKKLEAMQ